MSAQPKIEPVSDFTVMMVPQEYCAYEWPSVCDLLEPAVKRSHGRWTMRDLLQTLCTGGQQLWIVRNREDEIVAALTTQFVQYPSRNMLAIQFLGGEGFDDWNDGFLDVIEHFARDIGCHGIEAPARFGFWPFFKRRGYDKSYCTYECSFTEDKS